MTEEIIHLAPKLPPRADVNMTSAVKAAMDRLGAPRRLTVLVNDPQRDTRTPEVLRHIAAQAGGAQIRILVATGTHRFPADARGTFEQKLSAAIATEKIRWHDSRSTELQTVGQGDSAWRCHPWLMDRNWALLAIGSVEPHYFAGLTGAHKTLTIGCAAYDDIERNHANAVNPNCQPGRLAGNPVYEGVAQMLSQLESIRTTAAVNLVQAGQRLIAAAGGGAIETLRKLAPVVEQTFIHRIDRRADVVIAEVSGALGVSLYQADKGIKNCEQAVRNGGTLILVAPCPDGIGQDHFVKLLADAPTHAAAINIISQRGYKLGDHKAVRLRYLTDPQCRNVKLIIVSDGISTQQASAVGATKAATIEDALKSIAEAESKKIYHVADAGNTCLIAPGGE